MLTYTLIDWGFTILSLAATFLLGIYYGAACLLGIAAYLLYPILIEILHNLFSQTNQIQLFEQYTIPIVYHEDYNITACGIEKMHPFDSCKYGRVFKDILRHYPHTQAFTPKYISRGLLIELGMSKWYLFKMCYSAYTSTLIELPLLFLPGAFLRQCLLDRMLLATSGSLYGALLALEKGWAINLSGGYHHASLNGGGGFCVYPDITLIIRYLQKYHNIHKIMVIDLDAHQGNGYQRDFLDRSILIVDFYNSYIYPGDHEAAKAISLFQHVDKDTSDEEYIHLLKNALSNKFDVDFIIYNAGTDVMAGDPLGGCFLSPECIKRRDDYVFRWARERHTPILMLLSGGYQKENTYVISESILQLIKNE